jgi:hypothetical protein
MMLDAMGFEAGWGKALDQLVAYMQSIYRRRGSFNIHPHGFGFIKLLENGIRIV